MSATVASVGEMVRSWRELRRLSQLDLAVEAEVSQKHLSFIESGRSTPSREMVLHLAEQLDVPLRERNTMLLAAGFAPVFRDRPWDDPALGRARASVERLLTAHEPYPALTFDRHWNVLSANQAVWSLLGTVDPGLLKPPANILRISLHPAGLAPQIVNITEWRGHLLDRAVSGRRACGCRRVRQGSAETEKTRARPHRIPSRQLSMVRVNRRRWNRPLQ
jgi:transcriptional regulator with XRE-family HTH domain